MSAAPTVGWRTDSPVLNMMLLGAASDGSEFISSRVRPPESCATGESTKVASSRRSVDEATRHKALAWTRVCSTRARLR